MTPPIKRRPTGFSLPARLLFSRDNFETRRRLALNFARKSARRAFLKDKKVEVPKSLSPGALHELRAHSAAIDCVNTNRRLVPQEKQGQLQNVLYRYLSETDANEKMSYAKMAEKLIGKSEASRKLLLAEVLHHGLSEPPEIIARQLATGRKIPAALFWPLIAEDAMTRLEEELYNSREVLAVAEREDLQELVKEIMRDVAAKAVTYRFPSGSPSKLLAVQTLIHDRLNGVPNEITYHKKAGKLSVARAARQIGAKDLAHLHATAQFLYKALHFDK